MDDGLPSPVLLPGMVRAQRHGARGLNGGCLAFRFFWLVCGQQLQRKASQCMSAVLLEHSPQWVKRSCTVLCCHGHAVAEVTHVIWQQPIYGILEAGEGAADVRVAAAPDVLLDVLLLPLHDGWPSLGRSCLGQHGAASTRSMCQQQATKICMLPPIIQ